MNEVILKKPFVSREERFKEKVKEEIPSACTYSPKTKSWTTPTFNMKFGFRAPVIVVTPRNQ